MSHDRERAALVRVEVETGQPRGYAPDRWLMVNGTRIDVPELVEEELRELAARLNAALKPPGARVRDLDWHLEPEDFAERPPEAEATARGPLSPGFGDRLTEVVPVRGKRAKR